MARVAVIAKVYPESTEIDLSELLSKIKSKLPEGFEVIDSREVPIAFGLKALQLAVAIPEETEGGTEELESLLRSVEGVQEVEIESVTRIS